MRTSTTSTVYNIQAATTRSRTAVPIRQLSLADRSLSTADVQTYRGPGPSLVTEVFYCAWSVGLEYTLPASMRDINSRPIYSFRKLLKTHLSSGGCRA